MKRLLLTVFLLPLFLASSVMAVDPVQFDITGLSYNNEAPEQVGTVTTMLGILEPENGFTYPLVLDMVNNQFTYVWTSTITSIVTTFNTEITYANTTFTIYEDAIGGGTAADPGTNPPNGTAPSTYTDGTAILIGTLSNVTRIDLNPLFPQNITFVGEIAFTGGTRVGELQNGDWTYHGGLSDDVVFNIPAGYRWRWTTKAVFFETVPVEESTWGRVKSLYR